MIYSLLNYFLDKKINKLRPLVNRGLSHDLEERKATLNKIASKDVVASLIYSDDTGAVNSQIEVISRRIEMERKYILLMDRFRADSKRRFMIKKNFHAYLAALKYQQDTGGISIDRGVLTAPSNIYGVINEVEKSFDGFF